MFDRLKWEERFRLGEDSHRELKWMSYTLILIATIPTILANIILYTPLFGMFGSNSPAVLYAATTALTFGITLSVLAYLNFAKIASFSNPILLIGSAGIWLWAPIFVPFTEQFYVDFWPVGEAKVLMNPRFSFFNASLTNYTAITTSFIAFFVFCFGVRMLLQFRGVKRKKDGIERFRSKKTIFGDARWGEWRKMRSEVAGYDNASIIIGEDYDPTKNKTRFVARDPTTYGKGGELIKMDSGFESGHVLVVAGSGAGKTEAYVKPNCATYAHGVVAVDPLGNVYQSVKQEREALGRKVVELNLENGLDFVSIIRKSLKDNDPQIYADLANIIMPEKSKTEFNEFYDGQTYPLIKALLRYLIEIKESIQPLQDLYKIVGGGQADLKKQLTKLAEEVSDPDLCAAFNRVAEQGDRFMEWFYPNLTGALAWVGNRDISDAYNPSNPNILDEIDDQTDIFLTIDRDRYRDRDKSSLSLARSILSTLMIYFRRTKHHRNPRLVIVDEAALLGYFKIFEEIRDEARNDKIHLMMIFQTFSQLDVYGKNAVTAWRAGVACTALSRIEEDEAEKASKLIGSLTVNAPSKGASSSSNSTGFVPSSFGTSENTTLQRANLANPNEIRKYPQDSQIVFFARQDPLLIGKAFWFRRQYNKKHKAKTQSKVEKQEPIKVKSTEKPKKREYINNLRTALWLKPLPEPDLKKRQSLRLSNEELAERRIHLWKTLVYNDPIWGRRRFRELGMNEEDAITMDKMFHPGRDRSSDEIYNLTRKQEYLEREDHRSWSKDPAFLEAIEENERREMEHYQYQELHPDDYVIPDYISEPRPPEKQPQGVRAWDLLPRNFIICKCPNFEDCKCGHRGKILALNYCQYNFTLGMELVMPEKFFPYDRSTAPRLNDKVDYVHLPEPDRYFIKDSKLIPVPDYICVDSWRNLRAKLLNQHDEKPVNLTTVLQNMAGNYNNPTSKEELHSRWAQT